MSMTTELAQRMKAAAEKGCCLTLLPDDCRAMVEALEARDKQIAEHNFENRLLASADRDIKALRQRIAELEASHSTLRETLAAIHNTIKLDGFTTPLAVIMRNAQCAYEESAAAAGVAVEGK
ncbi:hypothetical protein [Escherichia coli]|uniref:hypothetical protein n=1 Tax=Escherichia coli TaxID=562 RepID=UPI00374CBC1D